MSLRDRKLRGLTRELFQESRLPLRDDPEHHHIFDPNHEGYQAGLREAARRLKKTLDELGFSESPVDHSEDHIKKIKVK